MRLCRLIWRFSIVPGGIAGAAALVVVPAHALSEAPLAYSLPANVSPLPALTLVVALAVLVQQIFHACQELRAAIKAGSVRSQFPANLEAAPYVEDAVVGAASPHPVAGPFLPAVPARGRRVLIVEDNPINQIVALRAVTGLGYQAQMAPGGKEALAVFARDRFDAILMDCHMPGMDGYHVAAEMRRIEAIETAAKPTPIIAMTASVVEGDQQKCVAAGINDYLSKPMRLAALARTLERWTATASHSLAVPGARA
jgi:CheY-like chemotaxis protein